MPDQDHEAASAAVEGLVAKALERLTRTREPEASPGAGPVPYHQFARANDRAVAAEEALKAIGAEVGTLQNNYTAAIEAHTAEVASTVGMLQQRHIDDLALVELGMSDAHGRAALSTYWETLPESTRGKSQSAWWGEQVAAIKAHQADPENVTAPTLPRTLVGYGPAVEQPDTPDTPARRAGNPDRGTAASKVRKDFAALIGAAVAAGDRAEFQRLTAEADAAS